MLRSRLALTNYPAATKRLCCVAVAIDVAVSKRSDRVSAGRIDIALAKGHVDLAVAAAPILPHKGQLVASRVPDRILKAGVGNAG